MANKERDNEKYNELTEKLCKSYPEYPFLNGFVCSLISAKNSRRTIYYYTVHVIDFLKKVNKPINEITLDDYNIYSKNNKKKTIEDILISKGSLNLLDEIKNKIKGFGFRMNIEPEIWH